MLFNIGKTLPLLVLCGLSSAKPLTENRKRDTSGTTLYAYGGATNGAPVFYDHGLAYIGYSALSNSSTNITFAVDSSTTTVPWYIEANNTDSSNSTTAFSGSPLFYIVPTGFFDQAGFVKNESDVPAGGVVTGFSWFGSSVSYVGGSDLESAFWAVSTNTTGIWSLNWSLNNTNIDNAISVVLKSTPPTN